MPQCDQCGAHENLPYNCRHCGGTYCSNHRLPENHDCPGLDQWDDPDGLWGGGPDSSKPVDLGGGGSIAARLGIDTGPGSVFGYFRGNMTYLFLVLMWATFLSQLLLSVFLGLPGLSDFLFVLQSTHIERVWTWFTAIFAHGGFYHIAANSIVLYFFGPIVERRVGSRNFALLFLVSGAVAGLAQVLTAALTGSFSAVVGASGAGMAIMAVLTVLNPNLKVYLYFILPVPIWIITFGYAIFSVFIVLAPGGGAGAGGIAHFAHLAGLLIGLAYGEKLRREGRRGPQRLRFGGGGGGGRGGPGRGRF